VSTEPTGQPGTESQAAAAPIPMTESRQDRKERTRRLILDTALRLLETDSLGSLSLRQLTKAVGIVPTAFYRHFATLDELGLALVDESFATLRSMIREVRQDAPAPEELIDRSVDVLAAQLSAHEVHFRFIARERYGGVTPVREAIGHELSLFERELATDLARMPGLEKWGGEDLRLLAGLFVNLMVSSAAELVGARPGVRKSIEETLRRQARMVVVGVVGWQPLG